MTDVDHATSSRSAGRSATTARSGRGTRRRTTMSVAWSIWLAAGLLLALVHATGVGGDLPMLTISIVAPVVGTLAVRRYRPDPAWPWVLLIVAAITWTAAGAVRAAVDSTGDLSAGRNLLPDVIAISGYLLFAFALVRMLRAQGQASRSTSLSLDGWIMALSTMLVYWVVLVGPVLFHLDAAPVAKASIVIYPPISALLVTIAARMAFGPSGGTSQRLLLVGMLWLLVGDLAFLPLETGVVDQVPGRLFELPYALAYVLMSSAALHPSMRDVVRSRTAPPVATERRIGLIATALLAPALLLFVGSPARLIERLIVGTIAIGLAGAAIARVVLAARTQAQVEARLAHRATHDELTGLLNRSAVEEMIDRQLDAARSGGDVVAVLFVDLDHFKLVNDSYGHEVGDRLLLASADRLRTTVGPGDVVARLSGDEFLVVLDRTDELRAIDLASRICAVFDQPFEVAGAAWVTASIGIAVSDGSEGTTAKRLLRDADTAMYRAKGSGRGTSVLFEPSMRAASERQLDLINGLHLAIERDEFEVHYQVLIDPATGAVDGVEALARWRSPDGYVPPAEFITLAEDAGLISVIGERILREACEQVARWRRLPGSHDLTLSVNVSARQLVDHDLAQVVADALDDSGLDPSALWLEITESVIMVDTLDTVATMSALRGLGVHLSVDDFGTGYASLSYLQRYPVEQVKIDRQFVDGMCDHPEDAAVVSAIVGIATALDLSVVAEGVETDEQAGQLMALGCDLLQGYLFSRPLPALDLGPILLERNESTV